VSAARQEWTQGPTPPAALDREGQEEHLHKIAKNLCVNLGIRTDGARTAVFHALTDVRAPYRDIIDAQHAALVAAEEALHSLMPPYCSPEGPCPRCAWDSVAHEALTLVRKVLGTEGGE